MQDIRLTLQSIQYFSNTLADYTVFLFVIGASLWVLFWFKTRLLKELAKRANGTATTLDDMIVQTIKSIPIGFYYVLSIYLWFQVLTVQEWVTQSVYILFVVVVISQIWLTITRVVMHTLSTSYFHGKDGEHTVTFLSFVIKWIVWITVLLLILNNLWVAITPLITSLGIVWIAVAFAMQNILEDLFCSISLYLDKPFVLWDFVEVNGFSGTVTAIGVKTTRLKTIRWEELVMANRQLTNDTVRNYGKMEHRKVTNTFQVTYETSAEKLESLPEHIETMFDQWSDLTLEFIRLTELGAYGIMFEYRYMILTKEYDVYLTTQQMIHIALVKMLEKEWIELAYPTQKIWVKQ